MWDNEGAHERVDFLLFSPGRTPHERSHETSHEGVHGSAHESVQSSGHFSHVLFKGFTRGGGFPIWTRPSFFGPFSSLLGLSRFFWDFPDLLGDGPGIFPICLFPLSRPIKSTYDEQSLKGPRHNLDLSPEKSGKHPGLETPPV